MKTPRKNTMLGLGLAAALAGGALWYSRQEPLELPEARIKAEELADLEAAVNEQLKKLDAVEKEANEIIAKAKADFAPLFEKYGTLEKPKLFVKPDYKPEEKQHFEPSTKEKDARFKEILAEMYECGTALESYATMHPTEPALAKLETALNTSKSPVTEILNTDTGLKLVDLAQRLAQDEARGLDWKFYAIDRGYTWGKLKRAEPSATKDATQEKVLADIDPVLRKILSGYPEVWPKVKFLEQQEYAKVALKAHLTEGFYKWADDEIVCETPGTWAKLILNYAHEAGHAAGGLSARRAARHMQKIEAEKQEEISKRRQALQALQEAVSNYKAKPTKTNNWGIFSAHTAVELTKIDTLLTNAQGRAKLLDMYSQFSGTDEACAYLFEGMVANELAGTHPAGEWILAHRKLRMISSDGLHKTAYDFAEKLVKEKGGLKQAWDYLLNCPEEERDAIEKRIHDETPNFIAELMKQGITGESYRQLTSGFDQHWAKGRELTPQEADRMQDRLVTALKAYGEYTTAKVLN